jgi:hypothetical protein
MKVAMLALIAFASCASHKPELSQSVVRNNAKTYSYRDVSGQFEYAREVKLEKAKLASRVQVMASGEQKDKLLEKTFAISSIGSVKTNRGRALAIRPEISQHTVWLEGKRYFSQMKMNLKKRKLEVIMESPESKWNGTKELTLPKGRIFCFYSQLPECLVASGLLVRNQNSRNPVYFYLIWDSWPYHQEHFTGLTASAFVKASVSLERKEKNVLRHVVEVNGQIMNLHFSNDGSFIRMFWTTQGLSIIPPGEIQESQEL